MDSRLRGNDGELTISELHPSYWRNIPRGSLYKLTPKADPKGLPALQMASQTFESIGDGLPAIETHGDTAHRVGKSGHAADGARVSLVQTPAHFSEPTARVNGCDVAGVVDIAAMKLMTIVRNATPSDFVDLYAVLQTVPFRTVARNALERYGPADLEPLVVGKGLVWFEQANVQGDSVYVGTPVAWEDIKRFFRSSLRQLVFDLDAERQALGQR